MMVNFQVEQDCRECGRTFDNPESVRRHQRSHDGYEAYVLKWKWEGKRPVCACGCGVLTGWNVAAKDYARYAEGHGGKSTIGRSRTKEEKLAIGTKNAIKAKQWSVLNPEKMMLKVRAMNFVNLDPSKRSVKLIETFQTNNVSGSETMRPRFGAINDL